jgi:hypothetical protein
MDSAVVTLTNSAVTGNEAIASLGGAGGTGPGGTGQAGSGRLSTGGGLFNSGGTLTLRHTTVSGNSADTNPNQGP